jgi:hypothetical protein
MGTKNEGQCFMGKAKNITSLRFLRPPYDFPPEASGFFCKGRAGRLTQPPSFYHWLVSGTSMMVESSAVRPAHPGPVFSCMVILMLAGCQRL